MTRGAKISPHEPKGAKPDRRAHNGAVPQPGQPYHACFRPPNRARKLAEKLAESIKVYSVFSIYYV